MIISGYLPGKRLAEILEIPGHPFFLGCQFHPELKSKPDRCHPLFRAFVKAALQRAQKAMPLRAEPAEARTEPAAAS
jgi:CTP synthase